MRIVTIIQRYTTAPMPSDRRTIIWAEPDQQPLIADAIDAAQLGLVAIGSGSKDATMQLADAFDVEPLPDIRKATQTDGVDMLWLAGPWELEAPVRAQLRESGLFIVSCEPRPLTPADAARDEEESTAFRFVPLLRRSPGYRAAIDVFEPFGHRRCINIAMRSGAGHASLFARLYDAMDIIDALLGPAEVLDAALASSRQSVPDSLASMRGHVTINMRFPDNRCASVAISSAAGRWFRGMTILGEGGCLRIDEHSFEWIDASGAIVDQHRADNELSAGHLIGEQINRLIEGLDSGEPAPDHVTLLALCEAARLSCRTGSPEAPHRMLEMLKRP